LQDVPLPVWERFDSAVANSVSRMQNEAKFCGLYVCAFVVGIIVCAILPHLWRFTDHRRLSVLEPELMENALELGVARSLQGKEDTGDGYTRVYYEDCHAGSYKQIWNVKSLGDCKHSCDSNPDCCGFGYHHRGEMDNEPMCEFRDFGNCQGGCGKVSNTDYFYKQEYEAPWTEDAWDEEHHDDKGAWWILPFLGMPLIGITMIFVSTCFFHYSRYAIVQKNLEADKSISDACAELARSSGKDVQYLTMWTGFCRPKGTKSSRAVCISPVMQTIGVPVSGIDIVGMPTVLATTSVSSADRLQQLTEMKEKGLITEAEFQEKRTEILKSA